MDADGIIDRRRLRRKIGFWRAATFIVILLAVAAAIQWGTPSARQKDHIARIAVTGVVQDDDDMVDLIDEVAETDSVKALVVTISTPGGTTFGGERLHKALLRVGQNKPVVADIRTLAASAGYMIAASTDHIVAGDSSIVGSIGVIFQYPKIQDLLDKLGVRVDEIKSAPLKAEPSPFHETSPEAERMIRSLVLDSYDWFVDLVAERRGMDRRKVLALADGSIFTGRQAVRNGLVDEVGGEAEIRNYLADQGVDPKLEMVEWKPASGSAGGFVPRLAGLLYDRFSGPPTSLAEEIGRLAGGKLFLDGLVSVWQAGADRSSEE